MQQTHTHSRGNTAYLLRILFILATVLIAATPKAFAKDDPVRFRVESFLAENTDGTHDIMLAIWITPQQGYHFYAHNPGDTGRPTEIIPDRNMPGMTILYPAGTIAKDVFDPTATVMIHETATSFFVRLPAKDTTGKLAFTVKLLLCSDSNCWPVLQPLNATWNTTPNAPLNLPRASDQPWWKDLAAYTVASPADNGTVQTVGETGAAGLAAELGVQLPSGSGSGNALTPSSTVKNVPTTLTGGKTASNTPFASVRPVQSMQAPQRSSSPQTLTHSTATTKIPSAGTSATNSTDSPLFATSPPFSADAGYSLAPRYHLPSLEVSSFGMALLFGLLAGFILNFMPCVLPVISLKLSSLVSASSVADELDRIARFRQHNIWFAAGVMVWFMALAILFSFAQKAWGQIFQDERLVTGLLLLVFALGLSVFNVFEIPMFNLRGTTQPHGRWSAFSTGLLATLLATPCSGPFLGGVLGWAFLQPPIILSGILLAVGLGMAFPYICMAAWPGLVRHFPKPGAWTVTLQKLVGFFLMGTAAYLLTILPATRLPELLLLLWITALAAWIWGHFAGFNTSGLRRWSIRILCIVMVAAPLMYQNGDISGVRPWKTFEKQSFLATLGKRNIMVDFTADWCPNCKILEHTVLTDKNRAHWGKQFNLVFIRVDLTRNNPDGQALLSALGSQSIPVVALFPAGDGAAAPIVLRDLFTTDLAESAMQEAFGK